MPTEEECKIAEAFMNKVREQNRERQARYLSNPENKKKALSRQKERYNHLKEMKNPKDKEMNHSALLNPPKYDSDEEYNIVIQPKPRQVQKRRTFEPSDDEGENEKDEPRVFKRAKRKSKNT
jgi:hypothetical protein